MQNLDHIKVLIVDDNEAIHEDFRKILTNQADDFEKEKALVFGQNQKPSPAFPSYNIDSAYQGWEAVDLVQKAVDKGEPYSLAFVDIRMPPGWDGVKTIKKIWEIDRFIQIVICTAYSDYTFANFFEEFRRSDNFLILKKPFDPVEVLQMTYALSKKWELNFLLMSQLENLDNKVQEHIKKFEK